MTDYRNRQPVDAPRDIAIGWDDAKCAAVLIVVAGCALVAAIMAGLGA